MEGVKPSAVVGCPAGFKDCGHCRCVPADTCSRGFCDGPGPTNGNGSNVDPDSNISMRPSTVIGCPQSHVDCGPCLCVPSSTCTWCPGGGTAPPVVNPVTPRNSSVPYCPQDYVDCGSCLCVPETTCGSCPLLPVQILPVPLPNTSTRPSAIPGCPKGNVDCGTCLCVPESSCRWCPGALPGGNGSSPVPVTKPSKVPLCPASYVDCGRCSCVAESTCQFCSDEATTATTTRATTTATTVATTTTTTVATTGAVTTTAPGATSTALVTTTSTAGAGIVSRPSRVPFCPAGYVDCGTCLCVAQETCILCPGAWTNPTDEGQIVSKPSSVPYCPASYVDCGTCLCVPQSSCQYCPGAWSGGSGGSGGSSTPRPTPEIVARPSTVPYCPASYVDCGTCLCVPYATCQWCPGAYSSTPVHPGPALPAPPRPSLGHINSRPSVVIGCPASYVDCGTCLCVPLTSCQWCPGAYSPSRPSRPSPAPAPAPINSRPSTVPGCPASYVDCGTCLCVPQTTCRWCPGATAPAPALPAPSPTPVPAPSPIQSRPSTVPGCPASYKDCGTCLCVPETTCQWCPGSTMPIPAPTPVPTGPIQSRPSRIPGCPRGYVDCGTCLCVMQATCQYCPGARGPRRLENEHGFEGVV